MKLIRPTKEMMQAINAQLSGDAKTAESLIREHNLNRKEMELRIEKRGGKKYDLTLRRGRRSRRGPKAGGVVVRASAPSRDILAMIDGRTKVSTLVKLEQRVGELLSKRNGRQVARVRSAMKDILALRRKLDSAEKALAD